MEMACVQVEIFMGYKFSFERVCATPLFFEAKRWRMR
jgi:hypothetical protein